MNEATEAKENPKCPKCDKRLTQVRRPSGSMLNSDQFDAVRAGDWFCDCHTNGRGNTPYAYFWDSEVRLPAREEDGEKKCAYCHESLTDTYIEQGEVYFCSAGHLRRFIDHGPRTLSDAKEQAKPIFTEPKPCYVCGSPSFTRENGAVVAHYNGAGDRCSASETPQSAHLTWTCEWCGNVSYSSLGYDTHKPLCKKRPKPSPDIHRDCPECGTPTVYFRLEGEEHHCDAAVKCSRNNPPGSVPRPIKRPKLHVLFEGLAHVYDQTEADELYLELEANRDAILAARKHDSDAIDRLHTFVREHEAWMPEAWGRNVIEFLIEKIRALEATRISDDVALTLFAAKRMLQMQQRDPDSPTQVTIERLGRHLEGLSEDEITERMAREGKVRQ